MSRTVVELIDHVNEHREYNLRAAEINKKNPWKAKRHLDSAEIFGEVISVLNAPPLPPIEISAQAIEPPKQLRLWLMPDELEGIPPELAQELSASSVDKTELAILNILEDRGGIASLDQILIGLYRKLNEVHKRTTLTSRLYRMTQRKQIFTLPNKKGVYANREINELEASKLLGDFDEAS